jgi:hypothetical protein
MGVVRVRLYMCVCYEGQNVKYTSLVYLCESEWRNVRVPENSQILFVLQQWGIGTRLVMAKEQSFGKVIGLALVV